MKKDCKYPFAGKACRSQTLGDLWEFHHFYFIGKEKDDLPNQAPQSPPPRKSLVHPLDQHKLLYILHYDSQLTLYAFSTLQTILMRAPHQFVCASSTTSISSSNTPHQEKIKELLIRHRRSLLGKGFYGALYDSPVSPTGVWEWTSATRRPFWILLVQIARMLRG